jgi:uncharacterized phage infection (PIP) family protein YhgE
MTETNVILMPKETEEIKEVKQSVVSLCQSALAIEIDSIESYETSADVRGELNSAMKKIKTTFKPMVEAVKETKKQASDALKEANSLVEKAIAPIELADNHVKKQRELFSAEQNRLKRIEEEKERKRLQAIADKETKRLNDIADRATAKAIRLEEEGKEEEAEQARMKAKENLEKSEDVYVEPVAIEDKVSTRTKTAAGTAYNITTTTIHLPESPEDIRSLCRAIADGIIQTNTVQFSKGRLKTWADANEKQGRIYGMLIVKNTEERFRNN